MKRIIKCDKCHQNFIQKWVIPQKNWSQINSVAYWTEGRLWAKYELLCRSCLKDWFEYHRSDFINLVKPNKQKLFTNYRGFGLFDQPDRA